MNLRLITDGHMNHALVTEQGDIVGRVTNVSIEFGIQKRPVAHVTLFDLELELRPSDEVPRFGPQSAGRSL